MARYIDADALTAELKRMEMFITGMRCGKTQLTEAIAEYKKSVLRHIDEQPTADVVPKSEVAREIFEEIEEIAMHGVTPLGLCLMSMGEAAFAEFKKKYTEGQKDV